MLYGALTNLYFRYYRLELGDSTTATGRKILKHQCRTVAYELDGNYDIEFPLYDLPATCVEKGYTEAEALLGPVFQGKHQSESVIYGDTDSCYFKTHATDTETAIRIADAVAVKVNASFQPFMQNNFLCSDKFDNLIKAGREIVSDCGIFVTKKRYMLHLVDDEGSAVDKLKVMGLDTKKTILPKPIAKTINNSVEKFLKGSTWEELEDEIVEYKSKLIEEGQLLKYGIPGTVYGLEDYYSQYLKLGDSSKLRLPGHVRASILYNQCIDEYNDRVNPKITSGTKIRKYYLKNPIGKFKSIAIPTDLVDLPKWFIENYPIDNKMMTEKLVDNPIKNIVKAIGKEPPTKQTVLDRFLVSYDD